MSREIYWKIHFNSTPLKVYSFLSTPEGRKKFWAESADERNGRIHFKFANNQEYTSKIICAVPNSKFQIEYFNSIVVFNLFGDRHNGTDLHLINSEVPVTDYFANSSGWVSVLMTLKAAVDFDIDLRNHDHNRTWSERFVDN